ncbi:MAG TPA: hypothetical protein VG817_04375 [Gemmatimonadales bacterium]|nr:hypothetical protein [Gemmatimonadales bacterium]
MSLHIILGLADQKPHTEPTVVYAGRSGQAARDAMQKSSAPRFLIFNNPAGIPKNNPLAAANAAKTAPARSKK